MTRHPKKHRGVRLRSLFLWHRYFGLAAALFAVVLAVTGLLLNHTERLQLAKHAVQSSWLLDWYGIGAPSISTAFTAHGHWVSQVGGHVYWDEKALEGLAPPLRGALAFAQGVVIATADQLLWLNAKGEVIAKLGELDGVPANIDAIGLHHGRVALRTGQGDYLADTELLSWTANGAPLDIEWITPAAAPAGVTEALARAQRGAGLSLERVLLDLHSGRLFGRYGTFVMDAAAILIILLAITGVWHWAQRKRR